MSATSYLPGRWPSKYFRLNESLRPCSGWERVFSSRLVTDETFWLAHSKLHTRNKLNHQLLSILIICTIRSRRAQDYVLALQHRHIMFHKPALIVIQQSNPFATHRHSILGKALVLLVSLDLKCCHSYICDLSTL